MFNSFGFGDS